VIALVRLPDGGYQLLNGHRVKSVVSPGDPIPPDWRMEIRPYDWADRQEWGRLPEGAAFLIPVDDGFTRARVVSEDQVTITDLNNRPATAEERAS
jgi:hypothetical protein